jgi:signal transduction histidine kinase
VIAVLVEQYEPGAQSAGVTLGAEIVPTPVYLDEDLIVQVFVNLMDNALQHTPPGGAVTMGCRTQGSNVIAWVRDTGIGIAPEHLSHLFERFYRVDASRGRSQGGAGLGLAIVQSIVEAHNGRIVIASTPGDGTTVTLQFADDDDPPKGDLSDATLNTA